MNENSPLNALEQPEPLGLKKGDTIAVNGMAYHVKFVSALEVRMKPMGPATQFPLEKKEVSDE